MKKVHLAALAGLAAMVLSAPSASAHGVFKSALQEKYDFKLVSCYACHPKKSEIKPEMEEAFKENSKQFRNDFGKLFGKPLAGSDVTKKLTAAKELDREDPKRVAVEAEATETFLKALEKVEAMKHPEGGTYADALKAGKIENIKLRE